MKVQPRTLFLLDSIGAMVTALMLILVIAPFEHIFGMPKYALYILSFVAIAISLNSLKGYLNFREDWKKSLGIIIGLNLGYCCITVGLLIYHYPKVSLLGMVYFILEAFIISMLVWIEHRYLEGVQYAKR